MIITALEKKGKKVLVHFDDGTSVLLNYEVLMKNGLKKEEILSDSRFLFICEENLKYEIKHYAFNLLSRRLHSSTELRRKLQLKFHNTEFIENIIEYLVENRYLDDAKFASDFISEKSRSKLWGSRKISAELKRRGVHQTLSGTEFIGEITGDEDENLKKLAEKKLRSLRLRKIPEEKLWQRLTAFLISKGFEYDDIKRMVGSLIKDVSYEE